MFGYFDESTSSYLLLLTPYLHSYVLRMAICTCKYTPFHFAGIQGQQDWSTCSLFHNYCVGSMCRYMSLHEDKDATNKNSTLKN